MDHEPSKKNANGPCDRAEGLRDRAEGSGHAYKLLMNFPIIPKLGTTDYSLACGDVYATFMNEHTEEGAKFEEFLNRGNAPVNRMIAASFNGLITEEELEAYSRGCQPTLDTQSSQEASSVVLVPVLYTMAGMIGGV